MAMTMIRHSSRTVHGETHVAAVITDYLGNENVFQMYTEFHNGCMVLDIEEKYETETEAIERFNQVTA